jgi:hypothetical protein
MKLLRLPFTCGLLSLTASAALATEPSIPLPMPMQVGDPCPPSAIPCPPAYSCPAEAVPCRNQKVVVEMSQPEIRFVTPGGGGAPVAAGHDRGGEHADCKSNSNSKSCSFLNLSINRTRTKLLGGGVGGFPPQPITTIVPSFATATIPIALQTTQFVGGTEAFALGSRRDSLTTGEAAELIREIVRRENARLDTGRTEAAPVASSTCSELKSRVDKIENRLEQIEKRVDSIAAKLSKLP